MYLAIGAFVGGIAAISIFGIRNPYNFWASVTGWIIGGYSYRLHSRRWEIDPTAKKKQLAVAGYIALLAAIVAIQLIPDFAKMAEAIGVLGGCSMGIMVIGQRRRPKKMV